MDKLLVILRKPPYGVVNAAEAIRHAGGAAGFDYSPALYLMDGGVLLARKDQDAGATGFTNLGETLELMSGEFEIFADRESLGEYDLKETDLVDGVKVSERSFLVQAMKEAQSIMIF